MLSLGIDVAKTTVAVAWRCEDQEASLGTWANTPAGWDALAERLATSPATARQASQGIQVTLEPTGGYELPLALWAHQRGWRVVRPNPRQVREWARSQGRRAKTDAQDAQTLARYGMQPHLPLWRPLPSEVAELEQLLRQRDEVAELLRRERVREQQVQQHPQMPAAVPASIRRLITTLEEELARLEQAVKEHLRAHDALQQAQERLLSVPGIGARNVTALLSLLARWHALTGGEGTAKGLVAYAGLDPQPYVSGTSVHRHATISRQGDRLIRGRLYMGALGALRGHNPVRAFYERLVARGKVKKLALVAATRKLLVWAWAVYTTGVPFDAAKVLAHTP